MSTDEFEADPELLRKRAHSILVRNLLIAALILYMVTSLGFNSWNAIQGTKARAELLDCTTTQGKCFQRNQKQSGEIVQKIVDEIVTTRHVSVLAAACSTDPALRDLTHAERIDAIDLCVNKALQAEKKP